METFELKKEQINNIQSEERLMKIMPFEEYNVKLYILNRLKSKFNLYKIALCDEDWQIQEKAIEKLNSEKLLEKLVQKSGDRNVRINAIKKITSECFLVGVALNDPDWYIRRQATLYVKSESLLKEIILKSNDFSVVMVAINNIASDEILCEIFHKSENANVRAYSITRLYSNEVFSNMIRKDIKDAGFKRIPKRELFKFIFLRYNNKFLGGNPFPEKISYSKKLQYDMGLNIKRNLIKTIDDQRILKRISLGSNNWRNRKEAICRLNSSKTLERIMYYDKDKRARKAAAKKLGLNFLSSVYSKY